MAIRILYLFLILLFTSCEELEVDEDSIFEADPSEQIPEINEIEEIITNDNAYFNWFDHSEFALEFSYKLEYRGPADSEPLVHQSYFDWSEWTTSETESFYSLDEGNYTFYVKSRFDPFVEEELDNFVDFEINAIQGPSLRIYPLNQSAQTGDEIDVYLYFEEVPEELAVTGLHIDIQINTDELEFIINDFDYGELVTGFPGETIYPNPGYSEDGASVSIMGVADSSGTGIYGTGSIVRLRLRVKDQVGSFQILIYQEEDAFQNINGDWHGFSDPVSGSVTVEGAGQ